MILAVDDSAAWHLDNTRMNPHHYSFVRCFGPRGISLIQEKWPAYLYYNPYVSLDGEVCALSLILFPFTLLPKARLMERCDWVFTMMQKVKYGVISMKHLLADLLHWETLYVSGRLHKPVGCDTC